MSFSGEVRNELARVVSDNNCCRRAELASLLRMGGTAVIRGRRLGINFSTESASAARKVLSFIKGNFQVNTEVVVTRARRLRKNNSYHVKVLPANNVSAILEQLGFFSGDGVNGSDRSLLRRACCRRAYLRGAFLGGGSVSRPEGDYHLELVTGSHDFAARLLQIMKGFKLPAKLTDRKNDYIVYLKGGDAITLFLQLVGAHNALLEFENVRVVKNVRNRVNRLVNCETANLQKTVNAAVRQVENIRLIARVRGLDRLPATLRETAELRLRNPEATLQELVKLTDGAVSRSGMNHRLRRLEKMAEELGVKKEHE